MAGDVVRDGERDASIQQRVDAGLWGAALPAASLDTIVDAEMYAVLIYMKMTSTGAADASARRCLTSWWTANQLCKR